MRPELLRHRGFRRRSAGATMLHVARDALHVANLSLKQTNFCGDIVHGNRLRCGVNAVARKVGAIAGVRSADQVGHYRGIGEST